MASISSPPLYFPYTLKIVFMSELDQLPVLKLLNKARNKLRRVFGVVWCITALIFWRLKIFDLHGPDTAMTSSMTSGKNLYFSEILQTIRNSMQKPVCQFLSPVSRTLWQKLYQLKKTDLSFYNNFNIITLGSGSCAGDERSALHRGNDQFMSVLEWSKNNWSNTILVTRYLNMNLI